YFTAAYSEPSASNATSLRIDHSFSQKFSIFGRYNSAPSRQQSRNTQALSQYNQLGTKTKYFTFGSTQVFSSKLVNEARLNWSRNDGTYRNIFDGFGGGVPLPESALFPSNTLNGPRRGIITLVDLSLALAKAFEGINLGTDELFRNRQITVVDNLTW